MKVRDAINTRVISIDSDANLLEAARRMEEHQVDVLAVVTGDGSPAGVVTDHELASTAEASNPRTTPVATAMPEEMAGCYEDVEFVEAIQIMMLMRIRHMPVFDQHDQLIGFVSAQPRTHDIH